MDEINFFGEAVDVDLQYPVFASQLLHFLDLKDKETGGEKSVKRHRSDTRPVVPSDDVQPRAVKALAAEKTADSDRSRARHSI